MRYTVVFRNEARDEALDAAEYIAAHGSREAALRWYEGFENALASPETMPARCGYARENAMIPGVKLRQLVHKSY